jgi:hypothetical protein
MIFWEEMTKWEEMLAKMGVRGYCVGDTAIAVFEPLMPQGVEHKGERLLVQIKKFVFEPLMPQGVEHKDAKSMYRGGDMCLNL